MKLVLTCEHGGHDIPKIYDPLFTNQQAILETHRGYDLGALDLFHYLKPLSDFSISSTTSRLLIELNRSLHHSKLFSEFSKTLSKEEKKQLIESYYLVYRNKVENQIKEFINTGETVLHLSVHSFTPVLNDEVRDADIGLLFDSRKTLEKQFCKIFKENLNNLKSGYRLRFNYPYLGKADGFTTYLRKQIPENYLGIELEINQKFSTDNVMDLNLKQDVSTALKYYFTGKSK
ncbi:N-formylglutamate amidohydrolase [Bizionia arctica]|uniref:N-formylglutamate amidohydrolase n=1 Tax=Bizionia arctica TaxID=1495645 RepID=A0A917GQ98_9FLAO|nr:N-formylglutamate amidohydrolase [Bizionia arctica]GGG54089.1 hypothetical protein GCM10010976_26330 [Bizionia arctica]